MAVSLEKKYGKAKDEAEGAYRSAHGAIMDRERAEKDADYSGEREDRVKARNAWKEVERLVIKKAEADKRICIAYDEFAGARDRYCEARMKIESGAASADEWFEV